jgi:hypothetical protein
LVYALAVVNQYIGVALSAGISIGINLVGRNLKNLGKNNRTSVNLDGEC